MDQCITMTHSNTNCFYQASIEIKSQDIYDKDKIILFAKGLPAHELHALCIQWITENVDDLLLY